MNEEKQLHDFEKLAEAVSHYYGKSFPSPKKPELVAEEIIYFRNHYKELDPGNIKFYTYDFDNMIRSAELQKAIKEQWERENEEWATNHEVSLSVYPAMIENEEGQYILNFYFIPTWIEKGAHNPGGAIKKNIIDFADTMINGPSSPDGPSYPSYIGYIYDLGSSCP